MFITSLQCYNCLSQLTTCRTQNNQIFFLSQKKRNVLKHKQNNFSILFKFCHLTTFGFYFSGTEIFTKILKMGLYVRLEGQKNHRLEDTENRNRRYDLEQLPIENNFPLPFFINSLTNAYLAAPTILISSSIFSFTLFTFPGKSCRIFLYRISYISEYLIIT